jgi:hypothetical protein
MTAWGSGRSRRRRGGGSSNRAGARTRRRAGRRAARRRGRGRRRRRGGGRPPPRRAHARPLGAKSAAGLLAARPAWAPRRHRRGHTRVIKELRARDDLQAPAAHHERGRLQAKWGTSTRRAGFVFPQIKTEPQLRPRDQVPQNALIPMNYVRPLLCSRRRRFQNNRETGTDQANLLRPQPSLICSSQLHVLCVRMRRFPKRADGPSLGVLRHSET